MGYRGEGTNPLGAAEFLAHFGENDWAEAKRIAQIAEELKLSLTSEDRKLIPSYRTQRKLISVSVDGGSQVLFPFLRELSVGLIRVSAASDDLSEPVEPLLLPLKNYELFPPDAHPRSGPSKSSDSLHAFLSELFASNEIVRCFCEATHVTTDDLGEHAFKDTMTFTGVVRDLLEWAYIVNLVVRFKGLKVLIVRDGRLEQHGMQNSFLTRLRDFFASHHAFVVGVIKGTKLLREGIPMWVISDWVSEAEKPFYFRVPTELMDYVFRYEKQWNPEFDSSYVFGHRYVTKLFPQSFSPLESVITFDIPAYITKSNEIEEIVSTIYSCRSVLFGGSIGIVSKAHQSASINNEIVRQIEEAFESRSGITLPFRRWGLVD